MRYLSFVFMFMTSAAMGGVADVSWTNATENEDGTPLDDLAETRVYYELCSIGVTTSSPFVSAGPTETQAQITLAEGDWCFVATHLDASGNQSVVSNLATKTILPALPNPPSNLTIVNPVAYNLVEQENRLVMLPVGTVAPDTLCDPNTAAKGLVGSPAESKLLYAVSRDAVTWAGNVQPLLVFADCG